MAFWHSFSKPRRLMKAVRTHDLKRIEKLLNRGADVNTRDEYGTTPLLEATHRTDELVKFLLKHGADVTSRDNSGRTPLEFAAKYGHVKIVRTLLEHGADVNSQNNLGQTPLRLANINHRREVAEFLKEHGAVSKGKPDPMNKLFKDITSPAKSKKTPVRHKNLIPDGEIRIEGVQKFNSGTLYTVRNSRGSYTVLDIGTDTPPPDSEET